MTFLSSDKPEDIIALVERYPEFIECYQEIVEFRRKPEELIGMFSEALLEMDRNTVKYMIEEQQKELEEKDEMLKEQAACIAELEAALSSREKQ